jgi:predicted nucleic acid-binding protein
MATFVATSGALVPALFRLEMQNALLQAVRTKRLQRAVVEERLADLDGLDLRVDADSVSLSFQAGFALAERFQLSAYDAAYLELAIRARRPLMSRDEHLRSAARTMQVLWQP